ncbi:hypothetical protein Fot_11272 [Forsythia ovata]|uniref:Uncharacterized protein n=1 Tax=Forsythia ovata TaxID=205694 RepID=A0ABD1WJF4_9LAMI
MAKARDNHTQQRYNHEGHANAKSSDDNARRQTGRRQRTQQCPFPGTGSNYAAEITEAIPNLHTGLHAPNQGIAAGQVGPASLKSRSLAHTALSIDSIGIVPKTTMTYRHWQNKKPK